MILGPLSCSAVTLNNAYGYALAISVTSYGMAKTVEVLHLPAMQVETVEDVPPWLYGEGLYDEGPEVPQDEVRHMASDIQGAILLPTKILIVALHPVNLL